MNMNRTVWMVGLLIWLAGLQSGWSFYNPSTGRWLNRDPIEEKGDLNIYAFVRNEAIQQVDPWGRQIYPSPSLPYPYPGSPLPPRPNPNPKPEEPCCDRPCTDKGASYATGESFAIMVPGHQQGDKDPIDEVAAAIKRTLKNCKYGRGQYVKQQAQTIDNVSDVLKKVGQIQNGVRLYTVIVYDICTQKRCKWIGKCSPLHWVTRTSQRRQCKPESAEQHPFATENFDSVQAAQGAVERCKEEHIKEFDDGPAF